jgi:hypothetical protein
MPITRLIRHAATDLVVRVRAINQRYATPRLVMSPAVRWSLLALRVYLLLLVGLLGYKFVTLVAH